MNYQCKCGATVSPFIPCPVCETNKPIEHDLDGTPLPAGYQEYTAEQAYGRLLNVARRFYALWKKWDAGTITPDEKAEMLKMQEDYWQEEEVCYCGQTVKDHDMSHDVRVMPPYRSEENAPSEK